MNLRIPLATLAALLLLPALAPPAGAAAEADAVGPDVCTYDIIESIAVCLTRDSAGRVCFILYVGPSTPVHRCVDPRVLDAVAPCAEGKIVDVGVCVTRTSDAVCVSGHWGHYPFQECVDLRVNNAADASVKLYCRVGEPDCVGYLACVYETKHTRRVCIPDPCYTTSCWRADAAGPGIPDCVVIVPEGGDMGEKVCHDLDGACKVYYQRTTFLGTWTFCLVPPGGGDGGSSATETAGPARCLDVYWERDVVVGRIVSRSSCEYELCTYHDGQCRDLLA